MAVYEGTNGNDVLVGGVEDDVLRDLVGGDDSLSGGGGRDRLTVTRANGQGGAVTLDGGVGDDDLYFGGAGSTTAVTLLGGDGGDRIQIARPAKSRIEAGAGDDTIVADVQGAAGDHVAVLGGGRDTIRLLPGATPGALTVTDFVTGAAGDVVDLTSTLLISNHDTRTNPFASGHLRLAQSGANTVLQFDRDGGANGWVDLVVFENVSTGAFTKENFGGWSPNGAAPTASVFNGTGGADTVQDGVGDDTLYGFDDADVLFGTFGHDVLYGGNGNDRLSDNIGGADRLYGEAGDDVLQLNHGTSRSGAGVVLDGGTGNDELYYAGDWTRDVQPSLIGGAGDDRLSLFGSGRATLDAGSGDDLLTIDLTDLRDVVLGAGADVVKLYADATNPDNGGVVTIADFAVGETGDRLDPLSLYAAVGFSGAVTNWNGTSNLFSTGHFALIQRGADAVLRIDRNGGGDAFQDLVVFKNVSAAGFTAWNLTGHAPGGAATPALQLGGFGGDSLAGTSAADTLVGDIGADTLAGGVGADRLDGGLDADLLRGDAGNDLLTGGVGADRLEGGADADTLLGGAAADTLLGGDGADQLWGEAGLDSLEGGAGNDVYVVFDDLDAVLESAGAGFDAVWTDMDYTLGTNLEKLVSATAASLALTGNAVDNEVAGNSGNDTLSGLAGSDVLEGGGGHDLVFGGLGVDVLRGGAGNDRLWGDQGSDLMYGGLGDDLFVVFNEIDQLFEDAGQGWDTIFTDMNWTLQTGIEKVVSATSRALVLTGNAEGNEIVGNGGNDTLRALDGSDIVEGRGGADLLEGGNGNDGLYGGDGNDTLDGGTGNDFLFGAAGQDDFLVKGQGIDTLAGFTVGEDDVVLSAALYGAADTGTGVRLVVGAGAAATSGLATLLLDLSTNELRYDADGAGAGASVLIARLTGDLGGFSQADVIFGP